MLEQNQLAVSTAGAADRRSNRKVLALRALAKPVAPGVADNFGRRRPRGTHSLDLVVFKKRDSEYVVGRLE